MVRWPEKDFDARAERMPASPPTTIVREGGCWMTPDELRRDQADRWLALAGRDSHFRTFIGGGGARQPGFPHGSGLGSMIHESGTVK